MPATDRPTVPNETCDHPKARHVHGTYACYQSDKCRCDDCGAARSRYGRLLTKRDLGLVESRFEPSDESRAIVRRLQSKGMGWKRIALQAGLNPSTVWKLIYGRNGKPSELTLRENADKLRALEEGFMFEDHLLGDNTLVPGREAWEIIEELRRRGWWNAEIGRRIAGNDTAQSLQLRRKQVTVRALRTLRQLMCEPVPMRKSGRRMYDPSTGVKWREVPRRVDGVGGPVFFAKQSLGNRLLHDLSQTEVSVPIQQLEARFEGDVRRTLARMVDAGQVRAIRSDEGLRFAV